VFTSDAAASLVDAIAEQLGVEPETLALDGDPTLRATIGRRVRVTGAVRLAGGSLRVKLAGPLVR